MQARHGCERVVEAAECVRAEVDVRAARDGVGEAETREARRRRRIEDVDRERDRGRDHERRADDGEALTVRAMHPGEHAGGRRQVQAHVGETSTPARAGRCATALCSGRSTKTPTCCSSATMSAVCARAVAGSRSRSRERPRRGRTTRRSRRARPCPSGRRAPTRRRGAGCAAGGFWRDEGLQRSCLQLRRAAAEHIGRRDDSGSSRGRTRRPGASDL